MNVLPILLRWSFWTLLLLTLWLSLIPVTQVPPTLVFWDKAQHALGFAALALLGRMAYPNHGPSMVLGLAGFGAGIEIAQWQTGWRQGDWQDWLADALGILLGWLTWQLMQWTRQFLRR